MRKLFISTTITKNAICWQQEGNLTTGIYLINRKVIAQSKPAAEKGATLCPETMFLQSRLILGIRMCQFFGGQYCLLLWKKRFCRGNNKQAEKKEISSTTNSFQVDHHLRRSGVCVCATTLLVVYTVGRKKEREHNSV